MPSTSVYPLYISEGSLYHWWDFHVTCLGLSGQAIDITLPLWGALLFSVVSCFCCNESEKWCCCGYLHFIGWLIVADVICNVVVFIHLSIFFLDFLVQKNIMCQLTLCLISSTGGGGGGDTWCWLSGSASACMNERCVLSCPSLIKQMPNLWITYITGTYQCFSCWLADFMYAIGMKWES